MRVWQRLACEDAGFDWVEESNLADYHLLENAWVSAAALRHWEQRGAATLMIGEQIIGYPASGVTDDRVDVGESGACLRYAWDCLNLQERLLGEIEASRIEGEVHERATIDGIVVIEKGAKILPGVYIEGVAVIGANCKIGPNAYLRGKTMIGEGCHIGQAVEVKNAIIYPRTAMGHLTYCGDSVVGEGVNFGAGTIVSNFRHDGKNHRSMIDGALIDTGRRKFGAIIGDGVHTGIQTGIYPGRKLWPHTSTLPGEIVQRDLLPVG